jgi:hypothetical protein
MKKVIIIMPLILFSLILIAQKADDKIKNEQTKTVKTDADNKFTIMYDYETGEVNHYLPPAFKIKRIRPKVGSFIRIKVLNLPEGYTVNGEAEFENGNIEGAGVFGNFFKPEPVSVKEPAGDAAKPAPDSAEKKTDTILKERTQSLLQETAGKVTTAAKNYEELLKSKPKLNVNNFEESLETSVLKNYLNNKKNDKNDAALKAAKDDYNWQQHLISIYKDYLEQQIKVRDSLIKSLSKSVDKEIQEKPAVTKKQTYDKALADIQVPNSDLVNLKITVKDKKGNAVSTVPLSYYNRAGYKIDFSTGFFYTHLEDQEYKAVNKLSASAPFSNIDTVYQIKQKDKGKGKIAIGILAHYYPRWFKYFNVAASCGFSYQAENRIINFLTGMSVLCGNQQRFIISGGASFGKVKELDKNFFEIGKDYQNSVLNAKTEIPVTEKLKSSIFFGISYNLGTINNSKTVKRNF